MTDNVPLQTKDERKEIFRIIGEIKSTAEDLANLSRPMFNGLRFLSDSELSRRLSVSKSTLANYRLKGLFGFYSLEGKILYAEHEIEAYLYGIIILRSSSDSQKPSSIHTLTMAFYKDIKPMVNY